MRRFAVLVASALAACSAAHSPALIPPGTWGGNHVSLTVTAVGAAIEFDCAHGTVDEPPLLDAGGEFRLDGVYVREHGGPVYDGEPEDRHVASYFGRLEDSSLTLSVRLADDGTVIGPFTAVRGRPATLFKCL